MGAVAHIENYKEGHFFSIEGRGGMSWNGYENNVLLRNMGTDEDGVPRFVDVATAQGAGDIHDSRGIAVLDFDHDGDLDLAVNRNPGDLYKEEGVPPGLWRNDLGQSRNWLAVELRGTTSNRDAVGARVTLVVAGKTQHRQISAGSSYASQHTQRLYFGLDQADQAEKLTVQWPNGGRETFENLDANQLVRVVENTSWETLSLPRVPRPEPSEAMPGGR